MANLKEVEHWYSEALKVSGESRIQYLEEQLTGEPDLLQEVKTLVLSTGDEQSLLTQLREELNKEIDQDVNGQFPEVDKYDFLEEIGRGGMAIVYRAARRDGVFDHEVALKVLKRGMDTEDIVKRFRQERNVLARLRHPNIGQIYDGGVTTDGRPYFVMELIKGTSLIEYAEDNDLSVLKRLDLFIKVCQAVEFAHQNLIIHRDIKPSNILVDKNEQVKLMDFGIAKLVSPDNKWDFTIAEQKLLTPKFASPEQFDNEPVDIRSDVFQLGKVLELLLNGTKSDEDLWAISQYATREEKEDRYANVSELGEDINNYLTHKPISAKKSSGSYVLRKFISRHKTAVSLSSLLFVIIVLFTGLYIQQIGKERKQTENALIKAQNESQRAITALKKADEAAHRAQEASLKADSARKLAESRSESLVRANNLVRLEKERSEDEAAKSKAILGFVNSLFSEGHPNTSQGDTLSIFEIMERGEQNLSESDYRLDIKTEILRNTAKIYKAWNDNPRAHALYKQIKEYDKELYGESSERYFSSFFALAETSHNDHMVAHYQELLAELRRYGKPDKETYILTLLRMAEKYFYSNRYDKYEELFAKARLEFDLIKDESKEFAIWQTLAKYWSWGKDEKAEYCYQKAYQLIIDRYGTSSFQYAHCLHEHASYLGHMGHFNKAISQYKEALNITRNLYGDISYPIGFCYNGLGIVYQQKGELDSAAHNFKKATEIHEMLLGSENLQTLIAQKNWATMYYKSGQYEKAIPVLRQSVDDFVKYVPSFFQSIVKARYFLAESLKETGNWKEAEDLYRLNIKNILNYAEEHVTTPGIKTWEIINEGGVCEVLYGKGKINKSFQSFDTTLIMAKKHIPNHPFIPYHEVNYATRIAKEFQLYDSARNMIYRAEKNFETHHPGRINDIQKAKLRRGYCLWKLGEFEEGYSLIADCYNYFTPTNRPDLKNEARGYLDQMQEMVSIQSAISQVKGN